MPEFIRLFQVFAGIVAVLGALAIVGPERTAASGARTVAALALMLAGFAVIPLSEAVARRGAGRSGGRAKAGPPFVADSSFRLSPRELEVVEAFVRGASTKEIAADLGLSHSSIRNILSGAYKKLGVRNGAELLVRAARR